MLTFHLQAIRIARANLDSDHDVQNLQTVQHTYTKNAQITSRLTALTRRQKAGSIKNKSKIQKVIFLRPRK